MPWVTAARAVAGRLAGRNDRAPAGADLDEQRWFHAGKAGIMNRTSVMNAPATPV